MYFPLRITGFKLICRFFVLIAFCILVSDAQAQLPCGYKYSRLIKIDHTKVGNADMAGFTVYLTTTGLGDEALLKSVSNGGHVNSTNGYDIAFTAADGVTALSFQMENYVATTGEYEAWIKIPYVSHTADTYFYMYYGNSTIVANQSSTGAWDGNTLGVWHMDNGTYADVTSHGQTTTSNLTANNASGEVLSAVQFSGGAPNTPKQYVQVGLAGASTTAGTVDLWGEVTTYEASTYFFGHSSTQNATYTDRIQLYQADAAGTLELGMGNNHTQAAVMTLSKNTWYHIVLTWTGSGGGNGTYFVYVNGVQKATGTYASFSNLYTSAEVGDDGNAGQETESLTGSVDEVHISSVARPVGWALAEYNNISSPSTFYSISAEAVQWIGTTNNSWTTTTNWSSGAVPGAGANIIITNGANQPTLTSSETVGYIWVQSGATLTIPAANTLSVDYSTIVCGTISSAATGTLTYVATAATSPIDQYISGSGTYSLSLLTSNPGSASDTVFLNTSTPTVGSNFTISQGYFDGLTNSMNVAGNVTDNSVFIPATSTITLNGTSGTQSISSTEATGLTLYNLILNNTSATAPAFSTSSNINVKNQLTFNAANTGLFNLNSKTLTLGTSAASPGTLSYPAATAGWLYGGTMTRWFGTTAVAIPNNSGLFPVGSNGAQDVYQPLWFGSSANLTTGGTVSLLHSPTGAWHNAVSFTDASWTPPVTGNPIQGVSIAAWQLSTANGFALSGSNGQLRYGGYGFNIFVLTDIDACLVGSAIATYAASTNVNVPLEVNRTGISTAQLTNTWYIGTNNVTASPLPIQLISFDAVCQNYQPIIQWSTATETNNDHFTVDKTQDGINYTTVAIVKGAINSTTQRNYMVIDTTGNDAAGITYYRLSQTDLDGTTTPIQNAVYLPCAGIESIDAYSYQASVNVRISTDSSSDYSLSLTNILGQTVSQQNVHAVPGMNIFKLYPQVYSGIYVIRVVSSSKAYTRKIILSSGL